MSSDSVLPRIARGESGAVAECLDRYGGLVWTAARRWSSDSSDAEDIVQDIFIDLWRNAARFDPAQSSEVTFIMLVARRRLIDRARRRERSPVVTGLDESALSTATQASPVDLGDEVAVARECLAQLPVEQRQVLELNIDRGLSHGQIAERTGLALGTVKSHARRGLLRLRQLMQARLRPEEVS
ncbi:MAG: sigma-70 family RNA polymerase sigma factor [Pirellulales bacterium]|nr:sigma-70 family RNA polymerase sigma factor [Pirellulales bacterium]